MEKIVACYSRSGNTLKAAKELSVALGARLVEIKETHPRRGVIGFITCGMYATMRIPTAILPVDLPKDKPSLCVICGPIWGGKMSSPIRKFLITYKDKLGDVAYLITRGDSKRPYEETMDEMDQVLGKRRVGGLSLRGDIPENEMISLVRGFSGKLK
jgi:flavodoxin